MRVSYMNNYCIETFGMSIEDKIAELIKPYLANNNKIHERLYDICVYEISDCLNEMVFKAPLDMDETYFFDKVRAIVVNEVKMKWYEKKEKKDRLIDDIDKALNRDNFEGYGYDQYDPSNPYRD